MISKLYLIIKRLLHPYVFDLILHLTNIIIAMSEYFVGGTTCFAVARGGPLMLFDQISKHCWWRGMHPQHPQRWNRPWKALLNESLAEKNFVGQILGVKVQRTEMSRRMVSKTSPFATFTRLHHMYLHMSHT